MNHRAGLAAVTANEPGGNAGPSACKGMERLAQEDELRALWLDEQLVVQRIETRRVRANMAMGTYRRRRALVPA